MKRLHLFEVEDLAGCPNWIRDHVTAMIVVVHRWFGVPQVMADHLGPILSDLENKTSVTIVDVCSGNGGPMIDTLGLLALAKEPECQIELLLTDKMPSMRLVNELSQNDSNIRYLDRSIDACLPLLDQLEVSDLSRTGEAVAGRLPSVVRTLACGFHHFVPEQARLVLLDAQQANQPLVIFELTKGTVPPRWLWWTTLVPNFIFALLVSVFARPFTVRSFVFSFLLPIIPACFAWDGAVTSARTYREAEFHAMVATLPESSSYQWQYRTAPGAVVECSLIVGRPL